MPGGRGIALLLIVFFSVQFSRVYLYLSPGEPLCPMTGTAECPAHHMDEAACPHHEGQELAAAECPMSGDGGCALRCCKGDSDGVGIIPLEVFGIAAMVSYQRPETAWRILPQQTDAALENYLPAPFQPPRNLS